MSAVDKAAQMAALPVRGDEDPFVVATGVAAALAPQATRTYFTSLLWDSNRPGDIAYQQNQSLRGLFARHLPDHAQAAWAVSHQPQAKVLSQPAHFSIAIRSFWSTKSPTKWPMASSTNRPKGVRVAMEIG